MSWDIKDVLICNTIKYANENNKFAKENGSGKWTKKDGRELCSNTGVNNELIYFKVYFWGDFCVFCPTFQEGFVDKKPARFKVLCWHIFKLTVRKNFQGLSKMDF